MVVFHYKALLAQIPVDTLKCNIQIVGICCWRIEGFERLPNYIIQQLSM